MTTEQLIQELKKREPDCKKCHINFPDQYLCLSCIWYYIDQMGECDNLFMEASQNDKMDN